MDKSNNKRRILALIEILRKKSDSTKRIKLESIIDELNKKGIEVNNRKTLYDDFKILNEFGLNIEYDNGYYLLEAPFNLSEIKILLDSINTLKNLDNSFIKDLNKKLYAYVSEDDVVLLEKLKYVSNHSDSKLLQHMEDIIEAIKNKTSIKIKTHTNNEYIEIFPIFLYRTNEYYYFYYHYPNNSKIYHYRFDTVKDIVLLNNIDSLNISQRTILKKIEESSKSYAVGSDSELVNIKLLNNNEKIIHRFLDDFPGAIHTKDGFSLKTNLNNIFYSKIAEYGSEIVITNKNVANKYIKYLQSIINEY